ncbi:CoA pyrophosphatase [Belnapia rosea]|jgi:8-oxo-dGTP pyrophosphatase MutT (NUDIX family)|uniref:Mutator mutT protein n=1 Tax=Belnapia rosea TaxID=938405 RepID=A0A1G6JWH0_9PROT|nr:CoA pyrophosphatase [Belnapia rosea]SDB14664.1 mutator mutT protein [Belnapia rosea]SDC23102.1 mutator mutT protein [Belnapia rosea]
MTAAEIAARMADPAALARAGATASDDSEGLSPARMIGAAVLVPIVLHPRPGVLLTLRAAKMSSHAGQVSFPGGRIEAGETPEAAAVREAAEEVGLDPRLPELLGRLPPHATGTGFRITPIVGLVPPPLNLTPEPGEVEEAFELPLSVVLDPEAPERRRAEFRGRMREFWVWPHERHYIWGATAAILVNLARVLRG